MKLRYLIAFSLLLSGTALASPQGEWPEDMRGYSLPRKDWVMIIPATRQPDGTVSVWNRQDRWNREWTVPKATPAGMRTVSINGDSEDMRIVSASQIDNMSMDALSTLARKYGANAIAVAVTDENGEVAVAAWSKGNHATWQSEIPSGSARDGALEILDQIYSGADNLPPPDQVAEETEIGERSAHIVGERFNEDYQNMEYRIEGDYETVMSITRIEGLRTTRLNENAPASVDVVIEDNRGIEALLTGSGIVLY